MPRWPYDPPKNIGDLADVNLSTPATDSQVLVYDDGSGVWLPADQSGGGGGGGNAAYAETIGDGTTTSYVVTHNLATTDLTVQLWDVTGADPVEATGDASSITATSTNAITVTFASAPAIDSYRVVVLANGGAGGVGWSDRILPASGAGGTFDDEFDDETVTGWTEVTPTGTIVWTEGHDLMSARYFNQSANDLAALLKSLGASTPPVTIETAVRWMGPQTNNIMTGMVFTDGTTATSNMVSIVAYGATSNNAVNLQMWQGTLTAGAALGTAPAPLPNFQQYPWLHIRLRWVSANTWEVEFSPDGVSWSALGYTQQSRTMTPTHFGLVASVWGGGAVPRVSSYEYFRVTT